MSKPKSCSGGSLTEWCNNVGARRRQAACDPSKNLAVLIKHDKVDRQANRPVTELRAVKGIETRTSLLSSLTEEQSLSGRATLSRELRLP